MKLKYSFVYCIVISLALVIGFQNCSPAKILVSEASSDVVVTESCTDPSCTQMQVNEKAQRKLASIPNDILFVVDDSSSMKAIIDEVKSGIASLSEFQYPNNTKMAVTYMSVDNYDKNGEVLFGNSFLNAKFDLTPGHVKLVTSKTISNYVNQTEDLNKNYFVLSGCEEEWFSPNQENNLNQRCLDAAVQTPLYGTGVEAGVVSLEQLIKKYDFNSVPLFRKKAAVHIIFISDTHEPGAAYWGKAGALKSQRSVSELKDFILKNSPHINSLKISGVVPLPPQGSPHLTDLKVLGPIPESEEAAKVSGESFDSKTGKYKWWDYSYLPFIKQTGGVAIHPTTDNWGLLAENLVKESFYTGNVAVQLSKKIVKLKYIKLNGQEIDADQVEISPDAKSLYLNAAVSVTEDLNIEVDYISEK